MTQNLLLLDNQLFVFINHLPHNIIFDSVFLFFSGVGTYGLLWIGVMMVLFIWEEVKDKKGFMALILALSGSILISGLILKNIAKRPRPQFVIRETIVIGDSRETYSFPSTHSVIAFAAAYILAKEHKKWAKFYYLLAFLIAFSRIYLGKHYPGDVVMGAMIGVTIGYLSIIVTRKYIPKIK